MRVWLDDVRDEPNTKQPNLPQRCLAGVLKLVGFTLSSEGPWVRARTASEAISLIETGEVKEISLDHDLGDDDDGTGYTVACRIEELVHEGQIECPIMHIHSANPVGRARMQLAINAAYRYARRS